MKKTVLSCLSLMMVAACTTTPANDLLESENQKSVNLQSGAETSETLPPGMARVRFEFEGLTFNRLPMTKTEPVGLTDAGVNYLYIYEGETLLLRQVSDAVAEVAEVAGEAGVAGAAGGGEFGSPSLVLDYGTHALTFVASDFELDDTDNQVRSGNTFSARKTVTVNENTPVQSVVMARIKTGLRIVISDSPASLARVGRIRLTLTFPYITLPPGSQVAPTQHGGAISIQAQVPQTTPAALTLYTFCPSLTETFNQTVAVMMWEKDTNKILANKYVDAPLLINRITEVRGTWITTGTLFTVNTAWEDELIIDN